MWLVEALYRISSFLKCRGEHKFKKKTVLIFDPTGKEYTDFFGGGNCRRETFMRCIRCAIREDGGGFDY